jgi:hypothetical protein
MFARIGIQIAVLALADSKSKRAMPKRSDHLTPCFESRRWKSAGKHWQTVSSGKQTIFKKE